MYFSATPSHNASTLTPHTPSIPQKLMLQSSFKDNTITPLLPLNPKYTSGSKPTKSCLKHSHAYNAQNVQHCATALPLSVHFNPNLEHTRWFCRLEPPNFVGCPSTPNRNPHIAVHTACAKPMHLIPIHKPAPLYAPFEPSPVVLENVELDDVSIRGTVKVHNIAFEKHIFIRMSKDNWKTIDDVPCTYVCGISTADGCRPGVDRFSFAVSTDSFDVTTGLETYISMCICYKVNGQEFWDNNNGVDYLFKLVPTSLQSVDNACIAAGIPESTSALTKLSANITDRDSIKICHPRSLFYHGFDSSCQAAEAQPNLMTAISKANAGRYMHYSEARFSDIIGSNRLAYATCVSKMQSELAPIHNSTSLPALLQLSINNAFVNAQMEGIYRAQSPMRASSPIACAGMPLAASHIWSSMCSATPLHC